MTKKLTLCLLWLALAGVVWGAQQLINVGSAPNDGTGSPPRTAGQLINSNFTELYDRTFASVTEYGAVGDGVADDTTVIQTGIDATATANKALFFPPGTYRVTTNLTLPDNANVFGVRGQSIIDGDFNSIKPFGVMRNSVATALPIDAYPTTWNTNITVRHLTIQKGGNTGPGLVLFAVRNAEVEGLEVYGSTMADWALALLTEHGKIHSCITSNTGAVFQDGIHLVGGNDNLIFDNQIWSGDDSIAIGNSWNVGSTNNLVMNNRVYSSHGHALRVVMANGATFTNTPNKYLERLAVIGMTGFAGVEKNGLIYIQDILSGQALGIPLIRDVTIKGVSLSAGDAHIEGLPWGVYLIGGQRIRFEDVHIFKNNRSGFRVEDCNDLFIRGSSATTPLTTTAGFRALDLINVTNVVISDSSFRNNNANQSVGRVSGGVNIRVIGNEFLDVNTGGNALSLESVQSATVVGNRLTGIANGININSAPNDDIFTSGNSFDLNLASHIVGPTVPTNVVSMNNKSIYIKAPGFADMLKLERSDGAVNFGISFPNSRTTFRLSNSWLLMGNNVLTDTTARSAFISAPHYTLAEEPVIGMRFNITSGQNTLSIGGGTASGNAMEVVNFYTAADDTSTTGVFAGGFQHNGAVADDTYFRLTEAVTDLTYRVQIGPNNSGPGGSGRALYLINK